MDRHIEFFQIGQYFTSGEFGYSGPNSCGTHRVETLLSPRQLWIFLVPSLSVLPVFYFSNMVVV